MRYLQCCYFAFLLLLDFLSTFGITRANIVPIPNNTNEKNLCTTQICEEAGNEIIKNLDQSVDPCDDFYKHACGGWIARESKPGQFQGTSQIENFAKKLQVQLRDLLNELVQKNEPSDSETLRKVTDYYRSCKDMDAINARCLTPLEPIVLANGGWPLTFPAKDWNLENQNLTLQKIHENYVKAVASSALFNIQVYPDPSNSTAKMLHWLSLTPSFLTPQQRQISYATQRTKRDTTVSAYYVEYTQMVAEELARLRGFNVSSLNITDEVSEMLNFRSSLDELVSTMTKEEYDTKSYYKVTTIGDVQNTWNTAVSGHPEYAIDWLETIRCSFNGTGIVIDATEKILLVRRNIVENLAELLKKNSLRTVVNYVHWHAIDKLVPYTQPYEENDEQRSFFCTDYHKMQEGISYAYVRKYFGENLSLTTVNDMVSQIQAEMKRQIDQSTWMDDGEKSQSKEKVDNMLKNIGYPSWYDEPGKIDEYYNDVVVGPHYFENAVNFDRFEMIKTMKKLREPCDRLHGEWITLPTTLNAAYRADLNGINIPAVNFQLPFFHAKIPLIMNYGKTGSLIGQVISQAFDNQGIMFDKIGNKEQWLSDSTITKYNEKAKCFIDQYSNMTILPTLISNETLFKFPVKAISVNINGKDTLKRNLADNIGFTIALKAYLFYKKEHNLEDIKVPELANSADEKLFFYSLANRHCATQGYEVLSKYRNYRSIPSSLRINAALSNMQDFSKAFNCSSGSRMNPVNKCVLFN